MVSTDAQVEIMQGIDPELLLRGESGLDAALSARIFTYAWFRRWLEKLPTAGKDTIVQTVRDTYASDHSWRWTVTPAEHKSLAARAFRLFQAKVSLVRCDSLGKELDLLESHGVDTRALEDTLCGCVSTQKGSGMRDVTELYQRLITWGASCTSKVGT